MAKLGKRVVDELYVHLSALADLEDEHLRTRIEAAVHFLGSESGPRPNVAKVNLRTGRLSLLSYPEFDEDPFPQLVASWTFSPASSTDPAFRTYGDSLNPPILHRKELLVQTAHPARERWANLTATAETLGLFDDTTTIGFRLNWTRLVESKGYRIDGENFVPIGNAVDCSPAEPALIGSAAIQRHLTALTRNSLSAPVQLLLRHGLVPPGATVFDYGCGRGGDVTELTSTGIAANGWDPHFAADQPVFEADVVNLGFVVNVIEDPAERVDALHRAFKLARNVLSVGVMLYGSDPPGRPFRDGFITSRNTFQKYFTQAEFKDWVEQVLHQEAFMVGPGVAFIFADKEAEQRFSAGCFRRRDLSSRLLAVRARSPRLPREPKPQVAKQSRQPHVSRATQEFERARPHLDVLWATALDLGRLPEPTEVANLGEIEANVGGLPRALRALTRNYQQSLLAAAAASRADDIRLFMAVQQFSRRRPYGQLEARLQRDIKAFFGDYRSAQAAGLRLLQEAADTAQILLACQRAATEGLGWLENGHSLQLHRSMVDRLPAVLRAFVECGLILWGSMSEVHLVKIHITSGKLTLMEFDDFDSSPLPLLRRRVKVNVRKQDYDLFDYGSAAHPKPLLYRKSRYLHEDYPGYAEQFAFDEALAATDILGESEFGPTFEELVHRLELLRLAVSGMRLVRSTSIPDLDQACGSHFTYRSFIECGETQRRLGIRNLPLNPATYNALFDLATQILDPVIDYFGGIRLTYGFCSTELNRNITSGVAPRIDQHASCEVGSKGTLICKRAGASCDFMVDDEDMLDVADWILKNLPFDRLYVYGEKRPIHVSVGPESSKQAFHLKVTPSGRVIPTSWAGRDPKCSVLHQQSP
jgi:DNA phosphorothioation-associated putative methyltransferase